MYRFALRPRWLVGHVLIVAVVGVTLSLGLWQLRRLEERREFNVRLVERSASVVPLDRAPAAASEAELSRVRAEGFYDQAQEVLLRHRTLNGIPGHHVLTPLVLDDGTAIVVNRGWIPLEVAERWPAAEAGPPAGRVEVEGLLRAGHGPARFNATRAPAGHLVVGSVDLDALDEQLPAELRGLYLQRLGGRTDELPVALPAPEASDGPHLSYALQWFSFGAIFAVGWAALLRSHARPRKRPEEPRGDRAAPGALVR